MDPNLKDKDGETLLMYAARRDNIKMAKALLEAGADVNAVDNSENYDAIRYAMRFSDIEMLKLLLKYSNPSITSPKL